MRSLLFTSSLADGELEKKKEKTYCVDECGRILISFFSKFQMSEEKEPVFFCIICLMRIYFKLKNYRNSKTLVEWLDKTNLNLEELPKSEVTTFYYYSGRLALYEIKLMDSHRILTNAFNICKNDHFTNKKVILEYLIPLNLFYGIVPSNESMKSYNLESYIILVESFKNGDLTNFEKSVEALEERLISLGTFLIIEKLKGYVMRNLIKIIHKNYFADYQNASTIPIIKIELIHRILKYCIGYKDMDIDELELYLIGMVYKGLISGYIHNTNKVIVFSKKSPFPKLSEVFKTNYNKIV
jgi:hypothetical protein